LEIHDVPGNHIDMFLEPNVLVMADKLRECLLEVQEIGTVTAADYMPRSLLLLVAIAGRYSSDPAGSITHYSPGCVRPERLLVPTTFCNSRILPGQPHHTVAARLRA